MVRRPLNDEEVPWLLCATLLLGAATERDFAEHLLWNVDVRLSLNS